MLAFFFAYKIRGGEIEFMRVGFGQRYKLHTIQYYAKDKLQDVRLSIGLVTNPDLTLLIIGMRTV